MVLQDHKSIHIRMNKIIFESASKLIQAIKNGQYSVEEITSAYLQQIQKHNPTINAITDMFSSDAILKQAKQKDKQLKEGKALGPLHGLPMAIKDSYNVQGLISSNGVPYLKNNRVDTDATLVKHLKDAGAIIMGKTNLPLLAIDWQSTNTWFGQTNNPYDLSRVVGGSSGGSAAALASGFSALEMGSDAGGSIRVPAHFCGVYGIRPTEGALSGRGHLESPGNVRSIRYITCCGPMARTAEDLQLAMEILWKSNNREQEIAPVPFKNSYWNQENGLKIAYSEQLGNIELDKDYKAVYDAFIQKLVQSNYSIQQAKPNYNSAKAIDIWGRVVGFDFSAGLPTYMPFKRLFTYLFIYGKYRCGSWSKSLAKGINISPKNYAKALEEKNDISDQFNQFFNDWDIWITPVGAIPAFKHQRAGKPFIINGKKVPYTQALMPYNFSTAIMGHPVVTIPIGQTKQGLPVGIQIHGRRWEDHRLLQIAKELSSFTEGFQIPNMFLA